MEELIEDTHRAAPKEAPATGSSRRLSAIAGEEIRAYAITNGAMVKALGRS